MLSRNLPSVQVGNQGFHPRPYFQIWFLPFVLPDIRFTQKFKNLVPKTFFLTGLSTNLSLQVLPSVSRFSASKPNSCPCSDARGSSASPCPRPRSCRLRPASAALPAPGCFSLRASYLTPCARTQRLNPPSKAYGLVFRWQLR